MLKNTARSGAGASENPTPYCALYNKLFFLLPALRIVQGSDSMVKSTSVVLEQLDEEDTD